MNRRTLLYICALAALLGVSTLRAQSDLPVNTVYREYRLEGVPITPDTNPAAAPIPAAAAVPEPKGWILFAFGGAVMALAGIRRPSLRAQRSKN